MSTEFVINDKSEIVPPVNDSPYKRILAVGDVHGKFNELKSLWRKLNVTDGDLVIFLGDYIDRGEGVGEVLKWVIAQSERKNFVFLRGNHEQMMLDAMKKDGRDKITWIVNGGKATLLALRELVAEKIFSLNDILNFAENLRLSYSIEVGGRKYFFCHAGVNCEAPLDKQTQDHLLWVREEFFYPYDGDEIIIVGHSPIKFFFDLDAVNPRPIKIPGRNILMVDTGAFMRGGRLSAVDILSGEIYQSGVDNQGDVIFVCGWNTCRSPMAKYIMRYLLKAARLSDKIRVDSAGCHTEDSGFLSGGAQNILSEKGVPIEEHVSKKFTAREYQNFKRVIALDRKTLQYLTKNFGDPDKKIRLFKDFDGGEISVADPYGGDYEPAYEEILRGCKVLLKELVK